MQAAGSDDTIIHRWLAGWDTYDIARGAGMKESEAYFRIHLLMPRIKRIRMMRREGAKRDTKTSPVEIRQNVD